MRVCTAGTCVRVPLYPQIQSPIAFLAAEAASDSAVADGHMTRAQQSELAEALERLEQVVAAAHEHTHGGCDDEACEDEACGGEGHHHHHHHHSDDEGSASEGGCCGEDDGTADFMDILEAAEGTGVCPLIALMDHSCVPNVEVEYPDFNDVASVMAVRPIAAGDTLYFCYCDEEDDFEDRQVALAHYGFTCQCTKCAAARS